MESQKRSLDTSPYASVECQSAYSGREEKLENIIKRERVRDTVCLKSYL